MGSTTTTPGPAASKRWRPGKLIAAIKSLFHILSLPTSPCRLPSLPAGPSEFPPVGNRVMGTLFGFRKGHVHLVVQENSKCPPILFLELATPTSSLVKEMASGLVRIALECDKAAGRGKLLQEPVWTMYCLDPKSKRVDCLWMHRQHGIVMQRRTVYGGHTDYETFKPELDSAWLKLEKLGKFTCS